MGVLMESSDASGRGLAAMALALCLCLADFGTCCLMTLVERARRGVFSTRWGWYPLRRRADMLLFPRRWRVISICSFLFLMP